MDVSFVQERKKKMIKIRIRRVHTGDHDVMINDGGGRVGKEIPADGYVIRYNDMTLYLRTSDLLKACQMRDVRDVPVEAESWGE